MAPRGYHTGKAGISKRHAMIQARNPQKGKT